MSKGQNINLLVYFHPPYLFASSIGKSLILYSGILCMASIMTYHGFDAWCRGGGGGGGGLVSKNSNLSSPL